MPGSQNAALPTGTNSNCVMDSNDSQNADVMDFDDGPGPADPRQEKQQLMHSDFYNDFGDLFDNVKL